ncbi:MAG TPA: ADP-forming succinate--CoA ligase subunit beta [Candidatus Thermoplasmatota archaeon]|nr:ADP-forming succinate--CoA ligase subunit beta [Candidatus Thermoplasmatota archaeon]
MNLFEYQGRELYVRYNIPCAAGFVVDSMDDLEKQVSLAQFPVVVKAQVLVGGRGKAGGVKFADDAQQLRTVTKSILGLDIKGHITRKVMVAQKLDFAREYYLSFLIDRATRRYMMIFSPDGGVEIESVPEERIFKVTIDPMTGFQPYHARAVLLKSGLDADTQKQVGDIMRKLFRMFVEMDAELCEVNPLASLKDGRVVAGDAKVVLNDSALYRHPEFKQRDENLTDLEQEAREKGVALVQLEGDIGVMANGAGLTMATLDALTHFGGKPKIFLDLSGTDNPEKVAEAVRLMKKAKPSVMFLNLFGGITKCDTVAKGLVSVLQKEGVDFPIITRIKGTNAKEANDILQSFGLETASTLQEAAKKASEMAKEPGKYKVVRASA